MIGSKISRRYAKALLSLGQDDGQYLEYGQNLQEFARFCSANKEFYEVISNRLFSVEERRKVLDIVLERSNFSNIIKNFLRLLLDKDRIGAVEEITDYYSQLTDELSGITRADIITARALKQESLDKLEKALKGFASKDVKINIQEDESLIGGIVVKMGDLVLDGSVIAQIEGLKESLKRGEYS